MLVSLISVYDTTYYLILVVRRIYTESRNNFVIIMHSIAEIKHMK